MYTGVTLVGGKYTSQLKQPRNESSIEQPALPVGPLLGGLPGKELGLFSVDFALATPEVGFLGLDTLGLGRELVSEDQSEVERNAKVCGDEVLVVEVAVLRVVDEYVVVLGEGDQNAETQSYVR